MSRIREASDANDYRWEIPGFRLKTRRPSPGKLSSISKLSIGLFSEALFHQFSQRRAHPTGAGLAPKHAPTRFASLIANIVEMPYSISRWSCQHRAPRADRGSYRQCSSQLPGALAIVPGCALLTDIVDSGKIEACCPRQQFSER